MLLMVGSSKLGPDAINFTSICIDLLIYKYSIKLLASYRRNCQKDFNQSKVQSKSHHLVYILLS